LFALAQGGGFGAQGGEAVLVLALEVVAQLVHDLLDVAPGLEHLVFDARVKLGGFAVEGGLRVVEALVEFAAQFVVALVGEADLGGEGFVGAAELAFHVRDALGEVVAETLDGLLQAVLDAVEAFPHLAILVAEQDVAHLVEVCRGIRRGGRRAHGGQVGWGG
jgi:hypothetical protein